MVFSIGSGGITSALNTIQCRLNVLEVQYLRYLCLNSMASYITYLSHALE